MSQVMHVAKVALLAIGCGWLAERVLGSDGHGWFVPVFSGAVGLYLGPPFVALVGWHWGPTIDDHFVLPVLAGAAITCLFVKLLSVGFAAGRR